MLHYKNISLESIEGEIWLPVVGYVGLYEVSNLGRVKSLNRLTFSGHKHREKILKQSIGTKSCEYLRVSFSKNGKSKPTRVHVHVGRAFIPNPMNKPQLNHKKAIKIDNRASELEWNTASENMKHASDMGLVVSPSAGKKRGLHFLSKLILDDQTGIFYDCLIDASKVKDIPQSSLSYMLRGVRKNITSLRYV